MRSSSDESTDDEWKVGAGSKPSPPSSPVARAHGTWSAEEHDRFLEAMRMYPMGPWSAIASFVGTRSVRQVHSHAQKYAAKVERHKRGQGKVKRSRTTGAPGSPSGHRVVPHIPGKFHCGYEEARSDEDEDSHQRPGRSERGQPDKSHDADDTKNVHDVPLFGKSSDPFDSRATHEPLRIAPTLPPQSMSTVPATFENDRLHTRLPAMSPGGLPSLDDSLDFFFRHFGTDLEIHSQLRHHHHHHPGHSADGRFVTRTRRCSSAEHYILKSTQQ